MSGLAFRGCASAGVGASPGPAFWGAIVRTHRPSVAGRGAVAPLRSEHEVHSGTEWSEHEVHSGAE